jgi:DNA-binding winged helix-turn-helix (wHTH) protein/tetratricopeptide (TPR) repeat protein
MTSTGNDDASTAADAGAVTFRFGDFRLDATTGDLARGAAAVPLQAQVARALLLLVSRRGSLVLREELVRHLWPDTVVEYDQGLNNIIRMLRRSLGDDAARPRFVQTVTRRGYRFVAPVEVVSTAMPAGGPTEPHQATAPRGRTSGRPALWLAITMAATALAAAGVSLWLSTRDGRVELPTLAVLPFAGSGPDADLLGASLAGELTRALSVLPGGSLRVIGQGSAARAGRNGAQPVAAGRVLGASHVVVGSVRDDGAGLSLSVGVLRVADGAQLWQDEVRTSWEGLLIAQSALASEIADHVGAVIGAGPHAGDSMIHAAAMERYLRARYFAARGRWEQAVPLLREVVETDPGFAAAHVALGEALLASPENPDATAEAGRAALTALRRAPADAQAHLLRARIALGCEWNWRLAETHLQRALELSAGDPKVHLARAIYLSSLGRHAEALEAAEIARKLDPLSATVQGDLAMLHFWAGDWEGVLRESERLLELEPEDRMSQSLRLEALLQQGQWRRARHLALSLLGSDEELRAARGSELRHRFLAIQEERWRRAAPGAMRAMTLASLVAEQGRTRDALAHLKNAVRLRSRYVPFLATDPHFSSLASDPEFQRLLATVRHPLASASRPPVAEVQLWPPVPGHVDAAGNKRSRSGGPGQQAASGKPEDPLADELPGLLTAEPACGVHGPVPDRRESLAAASIHFDDRRERQ